MNSVQENKNELEAAVRYCESAISRANKTIESMEFRQEMAKKQSFEQTGREAALNDRLMIATKEVEEQKSEIEAFERDVQQLERANLELVQQRDDLEAQVNALKQPEQPTMPVIPKAVAIAIFREGMQHGVEAACTELEGKTIYVEESEVFDAFEVSFTKDIDLDDELDLDYLRNSVNECDDSDVIDALKFLCEHNGFKCRIHGVDDQEEKKND